MSDKPPRPGSRGLLATVAAFAAGALLLSSAPAHALPDDAQSAPVEPQVSLADADATPETRSLFAYLRDLDEQGVLFGHQETLYFGESFDEQDGTSSDIHTATGDYPAVIGFDTLETAGMPLAEREANALTLAANIRQAYDVGAISTMTVHMENLVTGGDFYDTSGDALRAVLPGGSHHEELVAYLDRIALMAHNAVDADGNLIPIIFRPWHENAGSWFWWGASFGSPGEYKALFRFTVEYLRDVKGVHNFLYAFSPGGGFGGDAEFYMQTYPGDEFVDLLGIDTYDGSGASPEYLQGLVTDLGMVADIADERGKISALTEYGISGGVQPDGENANTTWYTDILDAIKSDPSASRTSYMLTWANYGGDTTPYTPVEGEMLPDFLAYYEDPYTHFASTLPDVYGHETVAVPTPVAHLVSPADGARAPAGPVTVRASVTGHDADRVTVTVEAGPAGQETEIDLVAPDEGEVWWTGTWDIPDDELDNSRRTLTLRVYSGDTEVDTDEVSVIVGPEPELPLGVVDDFESYGDAAALLGTWVQHTANTLELVRATDGDAVGGGDTAMRLGYSFANQSYTGVGRRISGDWSSFWDFEAWIDPDGSGNTLVLQLVADGVAFEAYPSLEEEEPYLATIPFADWRPAPWDTGNSDRRLDPDTLREVTQFSVFVNAVDGAATEGAVVADELRAVSGTPPPATYPDVPHEHPDHVAIEWLHDHVIDLAGHNGRFHPDRPVQRDELSDVVEAYRPGRTPDSDSRRTLVNRAEVADTLWQLAGAPESGETSTFDDVDPADPHAQAIAWATESDVIEPVSSRRFGVNRPVSRAELARWLYRLDSLPGRAL